MASLNGKKKYAAKILWLFPVIFWMGIIFYMSQNTGTSSGSLSLKVTERFISILNVIRGDSVSEQAQMTQFLHPIIRKLAHMCEYAILLLFMVPAVGAWVKGEKKIYIYTLSFILTFLYACTDELHQLFIDGRAGRPTDVLIDAIGAAAALLMIIVTGNSKWRIIAWFIFAMVIVACFLFLILFDFS